MELQRIMTISAKYQSGKFTNTLRDEKEDSGFLERVGAEMRTSCKSRKIRVGNWERGCRGLRDRRRGDEEKIVRYHLKWLQLWMCEEVDAGAKRRSQWVHFVESRKDEDENIMTRALKKWRSVGKKYEKNSTCDLSVVGISPIRESQWRPAERT